MKTLQFIHLGALMPPKVIWMRVNRVLAWGLIVSLPLQWALGMSFYRGLALDLAILLAHAALSLALFGMPKAPTRRFSVALHLLGQRPATLSARNLFLLSGQRVGLTVLLAFMLFALTGLLAPVWIAAGAVLAVWPLLRAPITLTEHLYPAIALALRRWGMRGHADDVAVLIVGVYFYMSFINLIR